MAHDITVSLIRRVAHKARRPLAATIQMTGLMLHDSMDNEDGKDNIQAIRVNAKEALATLDDLIALLRLQLMEVRFSAIKLHSLVDGAIQTIKNNSHQFIFLPTFDLSHLIKVDGDLATQALIRALLQLKGLSTAGSLFISSRQVGSHIYLIISEDKDVFAQSADVVEVLEKYSDESLAADALFCLLAMQRMGGSFQFHQVAGKRMLVQFMFCAEEAR